MFSRVFAGIIVCFISFNALVLKFFSLEAFIKASVASIFVGSIIGYLSYMEKRRTKDEEEKIAKKVFVKRKSKQKYKRKSSE